MGAWGSPSSATFSPPDGPPPTPPTITAVERRGSTTRAWVVLSKPLLAVTADPTQFTFSGSGLPANPTSVIGFSGNEVELAYSWPGMIPLGATMSYADAPGGIFDTDMLAAASQGPIGVNLD